MNSKSFNVKYSYNQFLKDFHAIMNWLNKIKSNNSSFDEVDKISKENFRYLNQVLSSGFNETAPNKTPLLKFWIGDQTLSDKPLEGEQRLFTSIQQYLFNYYKIKPEEWVSGSIHKLAQANSNDVYANEKYYEISQLFTAFGHTSTNGMQKERLSKLNRYADKKIFKPDFRKLYEAIIFVANDSRMPVNIIDNIQKGYDNPFVEKGDRNVGTPYWRKTSGMVNNTTIERSVFSLANRLYEKGKMNVSDIIKYKNIPSTMFGRNSTKGVEVELINGEFKIKEFKASPRVIYGVSLLNNTQLSRLYYSVLQGMKNQLDYSSLKGTNHLREIMPKMAKFDQSNQVYRISTDKSRYDTNISAELMVCAAICDILAFGSTTRIIDFILLSLAIDVLNPIYYKTNKNSPISIMKTFGGHKSGFYNTLRWGSLIGKILYTYGSLSLDSSWFYKMNRIYKTEGLPSSMFAGDDWSVIYKNLETAKKAAKIEEEQFGMISNISKSAYGTWFVQNGVNSQSKVSYPLARALRSIYYPERTVSNKPPFVLLMTVYSAIELLWESPHLDYFIKQHVLKADKYQGGLLYEGRKLTFKEFYQIFKKQAQDYGEHKIFNSNDPRYSNLVVNENGNEVIKSDWLLKIWTKISESSLDSKTQG